jgi:hypothetical protein
MHIVPDRGGKGYTTLLLDALKNEMIRQNGLELRLYVHQDNKKAIMVYAKSAFKKSPYEIMALKKMNSNRRMQTAFGSLALASAADAGRWR